MLKYDALIARDARAVELGRQVHKHPDSPQARFRLAQALFEMGQVRPAYEQLVRAGELDPRNREIQTILRLAKERLGQPHAANQPPMGALNP
jgi:thioredoxin-like negative regulator of GroEL